MLTHVCGVYLSCVSMVRTFVVRVRYACIYGVFLFYVCTTRACVWCACVVCMCGIFCEIAPYQDPNAPAPKPKAPKTHVNRANRGVRPDKITKLKQYWQVHV